MIFRAAAGHQGKAEEHEIGDPSLGWFITAALDAGVPLRDVQEAASMLIPEPRCGMTGPRGSLDRHATHIVAAYVASAGR